MRHSQHLNSKNSISRVGHQGSSSQIESVDGINDDEEIKGEDRSGDTGGAVELGEYRIGNRRRLLITDVEANKGSSENSDNIIRPQ